MKVHSFKSYGGEWFYRADGDSLICIQPSGGREKWFKVKDDWNWAGKTMKTMLKARGGAPALVKLFDEFKNHVWLQDIYNNVREARV